jgi:hypothetical protein
LCEVIMPRLRLDGALFAIGGRSALRRDRRARDTFRRDLKLPRHLLAQLDRHRVKRLADLIVKRHAAAGLREGPSVI